MVKQRAADVKNPDHRSGLILKKKERKMIKPLCVIMTLILLLFSAGLSPADIYSWVDENGVTHYSDTQPAHISEWEVQDGAPQNESQQNTQTRRYQYNPELISEILDALEDDDGEESEPPPSVELYVTSWCKYCHKAKRFFRSRGIAFAEYDIEKDRAAAQRMLSLTDSRGVPFAVINGYKIQGYSVGAYKRALKN
jgi:glutaredoxin-like YruB-family protein